MKEMIKKLQKRSNKKGFTLVEIIVVLVILAILAAIAVPAVLGYVNDAKESKYISEARAIYIVVQTEEAKWKAENNKTDADLVKGAAVYRTISDTITGTGEDQTVASGDEGVASKKTDLTCVSVNVKEKDSENRRIYTIKWKSTDGKFKEATLTSNKDVSIADQ